MSFIRRLKGRAPFYLLPIELAASAARIGRRKLNTIKCKIYGINVGPKSQIGKGLKFVHPWNIEIRNNCFIGNNIHLWSEKEESKLTIESNVEIARDCILDFSGGLTIQKSALISEGAIIYTHDHGYDPRSEPIAAPLVIGEGAWIGARAIILPSVRYIGANSIVGAGSIVTKDIPDDHIFVGPSGRILPKKNMDQA